MQRLKRAFNIDMARCGGHVKVIASIEDPSVIGHILKPLNLKTLPPNKPTAAPGPQNVLHQSLAYSIRLKLVYSMDCLTQCVYARFLHCQNSFRPVG